MHEVDPEGSFVQDIEELGLANSELVAGKGILKLSVVRTLPDRSSGLGLEVLGVL